jgi:hypothetical protein
MTNQATIEDYEWLVGPEANEWLAQVARSPATAAANLVVKLRRVLSPAQTSLILQQTEYRRRARHRFELAERMFFTDKGLQQATDDKIAAYKARETANVYGSDASGADLCCGIGGDLMQFAKHNKVTGFDLDEATARLARANVALVANNGSTSRCANVLQVTLSAYDWWHCDPDRRTEGRRTSQVLLSSPSESEMDQLLRDNPNGSIKLAPAAQLSDAWASRAELEWIGHNRQCQQQWARYGRLARHPGRATATTLDADGNVVHTLSGDRTEQASFASSIGAYLFEPTDAVIAARLTASLANRAGLEQVQPGIAYLTGDASVPVDGLTRFKVETLLPFDIKRLKAALRERRIGDLEIKKRGIDIDPAELRRKLRTRGDRQATLLVFPHGEQTVVAIAARD